MDTKPSRNAKIDLDWADGHYTFRMGWGELGELQEHCNAGPLVVLGRLGGVGWRVEDISHVIRLGLIGGGTEPAKALKLVRSYVEARPPMENTMLAAGILGAAVQGVPDEPVGKAPAAPTGETA